MGLVVVEFVWRHSIARPRKSLVRCKNLADISNSSRVIADFVPNFVAMATVVNRGRICLASFNSPTPKTPKVLGVYFGYMGGKIPWADWAQFFSEEDIPDVITCFKFGDDRFRGLATAEGQILPFLIDFDGRLYNTLTLQCVCVCARTGIGAEYLENG